LKKITLKADGTLEHIWIPGLHKKIPDDAVEVSDEITDSLLQNRESKKYDKARKAAVDYSPPFDISAAKLTGARVLENKLKKEFSSEVTSDALGAPHRYSLQTDQRLYLHEVVVLGKGGKLMCVAPNGVKKRRPHTQEELLKVVEDIVTTIDALVDEFETEKKALDDIGESGKKDDIEKIISRLKKKGKKS
jgi:hypothetical protein